MIEVSPLSASQVAPFAIFTFPALRPLLDADRPTPPAIFGARAEADPVGLSFGLMAPNRQFELLSLYVAPLWRGQGIGTRLLAAIEQHYRVEGCVLGAHFFSVNEQEPRFVEFLKRRGWSHMSIRQVVCQTTVDKILASPLKACARLPKEYRIIRWADVTPAQKAAICERRKCDPGWYPDQLDPFRHEQDCLIDTSLALVRRDDAVVGWLFSHALDDNTLRMTCSFVVKELERPGRVLHLWWAAAARQDAQTSLRRTIWTVPVTYAQHLKFVLNRVKPWMDQVSYACTAIKRFDDEEARAASDRS